MDRQKKHIKFDTNWNKFHKILSNTNHIISICVLRRIHLIDAKIEGTFYLFQNVEGFHEKHFVGANALVVLDITNATLNFSG